MLDVLVKSQDISAPSNHLVCLQIPGLCTVIGPIGSHWIGRDLHCLEAAGCSTSVPLRTRPKLDDPAVHTSMAVLRGDREASNLHSHLASAFI